MKIKRIEKGKEYGIPIKAIVEKDQPTRCKTGWTTWRADQDGILVTEGNSSLGVFVSEEDLAEVGYYFDKIKNESKKEALEDLEAMDKYGPPGFQSRGFDIP